MVHEIDGLFGYLEDKTEILEGSPDLGFPTGLSLHCTYSRDLVFAGLGHWTPSRISVAGRSGNYSVRSAACITNGLRYPQIKNTSPGSFQERQRQPAPPRSSGIRIFLSFPGSIPMKHLPNRILKGCSQTVCRGATFAGAEQALE